MNTDRCVEQYTAALGRSVFLRPGTSDRQTWADTFGGAGGYHRPPDEMPTPATVLDLGANIGLTAADYKAMWPAAEVRAVELDPYNAELAKLNAPGVDVTTGAVSAQGGWGSYAIDAAAEAYTFEPRVKAAGRRLAASWTMRQLILRGYEAHSVDFVKMDIEGAEWEILGKPDWAELVGSVLVELHPWGLLPDDSSTLVAAAIGAFVEAGFNARHHPPHPRAVWAWK